VPADSNCLPTALKDEDAPRLELAGIGKDPILCAVDTNKSRLLGTVGCWKVDLKNMKDDNVPLLYQDPKPLPGHDVRNALEDRCASEFCLPKDTKVKDTKLVHMSWNLDGSKVAMLVGDNVHLFDAASKDHEASFSVRGDKGLTNDPVAIYFVGGEVFVEG